MTVTEAVRPRTKLPWPALLALGAAVFLSITIEMLPMGLLPEMSADLGVSEPLIGLLVSVFAFTVVITSAPLTALTSRMPRRTLLVIVLVVLALTSAVSALVPEYWMLAAVRIVGGLAHGVFWALVVSTASRLVPDELIGRAVAIVLGGGTLALVAGVPAATALGQAVGWRAASAAVGALALAGAVLVWRALAASPEASAHSRFKRSRGAQNEIAQNVMTSALSPELGGGAGAVRSGERADVGASAASGGGADLTGSAASRERADVTASAVLRGAPLAQVLAVCLVTAVTMLGQYAAYTYIAPIITDVMAQPSGAVGPLLFVYGATGALGLVLTGTRFARRATAATAGSMTVAAVALVVLVVARDPWVAVTAFAVWGLAFGAIPPLLQTRLMQATAPSQRDAASALYTTAFNVGIGGGALVGGVLYGAFGIAVLPLAYAGVLVVAAGLLAIGRRRRADVGAHARSRVAAA